jgi:hypothetical protein
MIEVDNLDRKLEATLCKIGGYFFLTMKELVNFFLNKPIQQLLLALMII